MTGTRLRSDIVGRRLSPGLRILVLSAVINMLGGRPLFATPPARGEVKVVVAGSDRSFAAIAKSLTESLSFIAVTAQFERAASVDPRSVSEIHPPQLSLFARLWIDATADRDVTLYITDAATERVFVRHINLDHGLDTVVVETLALVAQSSLEALLAGKLIGVTRDDYEHSLEAPAPRPAPEPVPKQTAAPTPHDVQPSRWQLWAGYELQGWDGTTVRHQAALGIEYERWRLRLGVDLFGTWPIQFHSGELGAFASATPGPRDWSCDRAQSHTSRAKQSGCPDGIPVLRDRPDDARRSGHRAVLEPLVAAWNPGRGCRDPSRSICDHSPGRDRGGADALEGATLRGDRLGSKALESQSRN